MPIHIQTIPSVSSYSLANYNITSVVLPFNIPYQPSASKATPAATKTATTTPPCVPPQK
jgi:hypothetical protein